MSKTTLPVVSITGAPAFVTEDSGIPEVFTISLSQPAPVGGLQVNTTSFDTDGLDGDEVFSTDENVSDFVIVRNAAGTGSVLTSLTIAEGATSAQLIFTPIPDDIVEGAETNFFAILGGENYTVDPLQSFATTTLLDSTTLPIVSVTGAPAFVTEDSGIPEVFTISLSQPAPVGGLQLNINLSDSDGVSGDEIFSTENISNLAGTGPMLTSLTIAEGATFAQVIFTPIPDDIVEGAETNFLGILAGVGYTVDPLQSFATTTLLDSTPAYDSGISFG